MANQDDLRAIAGKALADPDFRQKLVADPEAAVKEAGIELTADQIQALKEMDKEQFEEGISDLDERLTMSCWSRSVGEVVPLPLPGDSSSADAIVGPMNVPRCGWD